MVTLYNVFPKRFKRVVVFFSAGMSALLFILVDLFTIQAIKDEVTLFHATSAALGIPVWIYYLGVPIFSVFVFRGIYRNAFSRLDALERGEREEKG